MKRTLAEQHAEVEDEMVKLGKAILATPLGRPILRLITLRAKRQALIERDFTSIRLILAAYCSTPTFITEEQMTAAWAAFDRLHRQFGRRPS